MTQLLQAPRDWWRRSFGARPGPATAVSWDHLPVNGSHALPDSPLARARLAARTARLATELDALERGAAPPEAIAARHSELITLRARLCSAAREPMH